MKKTSFKEALKNSDAFFDRHASAAKGAGSLIRAETAIVMGMSPGRAIQELREAAQAVWDNDYDAAHNYRDASSTWEAKDACTARFNRLHTAVHATRPEAAEPRPMDSAPRDGTEFLAWVPTALQGKGQWCTCLMLHGDWMNNRAWKIKPTLWMPLPEPPNVLLPQRERNGD